MQSKQLTIHTAHTNASIHTGLTWDVLYLFLKDRPLVVVEYAQYGDLLGYLRRSRGVQDNYYSDPSVKPGSTLTSRQLLKFAWEISDGMHYVSMKKVTFIHSRNSDW